MTISQHYRQLLVNAFRDYGPEAPTLCTGWDAHDLLVHLYIRENHPIAAAGMYIQSLAPKREEVEEKIKNTPWIRLIEEWGSGPKKFNPARYIDKYLNACEHFVHYADLVRAQKDWSFDKEPQLETKEAQELYAVLPFMARRFLKYSDCPVILFPEGFPRVMGHDIRGISENGEDIIRVIGSVGEIILWLYGREKAQVTLSGSLEKLHLTQV